MGLEWNILTFLIVVKQLDSGRKSIYGGGVYGLTDGDFAIGFGGEQV